MAPITSTSLTDSWSWIARARRGSASRISQNWHQKVREVQKSALRLVTLISGIDTQLVTLSMLVLAQVKLLGHVAQLNKLIRWVKLLYPRGQKTKKRHRIIAKFILLKLTVNCKPAIKTLQDNVSPFLGCSLTKKTANRYLINADSFLSNQ